MIRFYRDSKILEDDGKYQYVKVFSFDIIVFIYQLRKLLFLGNNLQTEISQNLGDITTFFAANQDEVFTRFDLKLKSEFLTDFLFSIQNFFKVTNQVLGQKYNDRGYMSLVTNILSELDIGKKNSEPYYVMKFSANVRNVLHSAGLFEDEDESGSIEDVNFIFKKNEHVEYYSWRHVYFLWIRYWIL